ncbi:MAG: hypothetical protein ACRCY4_06260, partial [Brevinema sp.]
LLLPLVATFVLAGCAVTPTGSSGVNVGGVVTDAQQLDLPSTLSATLGSIDTTQLHMRDGKTIARIYYTKIISSDRPYNDVTIPDIAALLDRLQTRIKFIDTRDESKRSFFTPTVVSSKRVTLSFMSVQTTFYVKAVNGGHAWLQEIDSAGKEGSIAIVALNTKILGVDPNIMQYAYSTFPALQNMPQAVKNHLSGNYPTANIAPTDANGIQYSLIIFDTTRN